MIKKDNTKPTTGVEKKSSIDEIKNNPNNSHNFNKIDAIIKYITRLKEDKFTGYLKINFSQGSIAKVEKFEEVLKLKSQE